MSNQILMPVIIISIFLTGCSSNPKNAVVPVDSGKICDIQNEHATGKTDTVRQQDTEKTKVSFGPLTDEMKTELKEILDRNLTEEDWERIKETNSKYGCRLDESDPGTQLFLVCTTPELLRDNPNLQKEIGDFLKQASPGRLQLNIQQRSDLQGKELLRKELEKGLERIFK